jgi:hypothetical protein
VGIGSRIGVSVAGKPTRGLHVAAGCRQVEGAGRRQARRRSLWLVASSDLRAAASDRLTPS